MRNLEQRSSTESLGELGAQAREARVVQEYIALHFPRNAFDSTGVYTSSTRAKGPVCAVCGGVKMLPTACSFVGLSSMAGKQ
jgi:hypothetical protein